MGWIWCARPTCSTLNSKVSMTVSAGGSQTHVRRGWGLDELFWQPTCCWFGPGVPQLPCLSPSGEHAVDCLKQKLVSRQPIQPKAKDHVKPQPLKINTNFHSGCDNPNYSMITSLSTSLIPVFALSVRLADSSLLHCPQQRRQKLCPATVQKIYSHNHFPWYVWNMKLK